MTSQEPLHYSEEKWEATVNDAYNNLPAEYPTYPCPDPGSTDFAQLIDHTLLKLDATAEQIDKLCEEAREYRFKVGALFCLSPQTSCSQKQVLRSFQ